MGDRMTEKVAQRLDQWAWSEFNADEQEYFMRHQISLQHARDALTTCHFDELVTALKEIAEGKGPFNRNPLLHAENVIEEAKATANAVLAKVEEK